MEADVTFAWHVLLAPVSLCHPPTGRKKVIFKLEVKTGSLLSDPQIRLLIPPVLLLREIVAVKAIRIYKKARQVRSVSLMFILLLGIVFYRAT